MEYVPAGVFVLLAPAGGVPPVPPPEPEQLASPPITRTPSRTSRKFLRRRTHANGSSTSPHASETAPHPASPALRVDNAEWPVATSTVKLPVELAATVSLAGLNVHTAFTGSEPHWKVNVPANPLAGVNTTA
jgi:hypothetical protein